MEKFKSLLLLSLLLVSCSDKGSQNSLNGLEVDSSQKQGVIGGKSVRAGDREIKSTVGIYDIQGQFICTGTLLSEELVLTAAHCIGQDPKQMIVVFKNNLRKFSAEDARPVIAAKKHEFYNPERILNTADIALIRIKTDKLPAGYEPAKLLPDFSLLKNGAPMVAVGYGLNWAWFFKSGAGVLRTTSLKIGDEHFSKTEVAVAESLGNGVCSGDSGGPGYMDIDGQLYLWGVVSRGDSSSKFYIPKCFRFTVYTRVDAFGEWIAKSIEELMSL